MGQKGVVTAAGQSVPDTVRGVAMLQKLWQHKCYMSLEYDKLKEWHITCTLTNKDHN